MGMSILDCVVVQQDEEDQLLTEYMQRAADVECEAISLPRYPTGTSISAMQAHLEGLDCLKPAGTRSDDIGSVFSAVCPSVTRSSGHEGARKALSLPELSLEMDDDAAWKGLRADARATEGASASEQAGHETCWFGCVADCSCDVDADLERRVGDALTDASCAWECEHMKDPGGLHRKIVGQEELPETQREPFQAVAELLQFDMPEVGTAFDAVDDAGGLSGSHAPAVELASMGYSSISATAGTSSLLSKD